MLFATMQSRYARIMTLKMLIYNKESSAPKRPYINLYQLLIHQEVQPKKNKKSTSSGITALEIKHFKQQLKYKE